MVDADMNGGLSAEYRLLVYGVGNGRVMFFTHSSRAYGRTESAYGDGSSCYFETPTLHSSGGNFISILSRLVSHYCVCALCELSLLQVLYKSNHLLPPCKACLIGLERPGFRFC